MRKTVIFNREKGTATVKSIVHNEKIARYRGVQIIERTCACSMNVLLLKKSGVIIGTVFDAEKIEIE